MIGVAIGVLGTLATMAHASRAPRPAERDLEVERLPRCTVSLVIVAPDDSLVSRSIDAKTGGHGFSHVFLDPCRFDPASGRRVYIDFSLERGLHWTTSDYAGRERARVYFDGHLGDEVYGCVASKMGAPFNVAAVVAGVESERTCAGLIVHCLPPALRRTLREAAGIKCVSPNDLAVFFGVEPGQTRRVSSRNGLERV